MYINRRSVDLGLNTFPMQLTNGLLCFTSDSSGSNCEVSREVGVPVCEAFVEADKVWRDFYFFESRKINLFDNDIWQV